MVAAGNDASLDVSSKCLQPTRERLVLTVASSRRHAAGKQRMQLSSSLRTPLHISLPMESTSPFLLPETSRKTLRKRGSELLPEFGGHPFLETGRWHDANVGNEHGHTARQRNRCASVAIQLQDG